MFEPTQLSFGMTAMLVTVAVAAWSDWKRWRVPNALLGVSALLALPSAVLAPSGIGLADSLMGGLTGVALFLPHYLLRGMAAGDVKLLGVAGLYAGPLMVFEIALASALVGGLWAIAVLVRRKHAGLVFQPEGCTKAECAPVRRTGLNRLTGGQVRRSGMTRNQAIPYGVVMAIGTALVMFASIR